MESRRLLRMDRAQWRKMRPNKPGPVLIGLEETPMADVCRDAAVIAATAEQVSSSGVEVKIYRYDPSDPKPYNVDSYAVWEDLPSRADFPEIVRAASTDCDANMNAFLEQTVFLVPKELGSFHWLDESELPHPVWMLRVGEGDAAAA